MSIGGDVSESGYSSKYDIAMVPSFDIPSQYIDENARQFRFSNGTTTDDHAIHLIGYKDESEKEKKRMRSLENKYLSLYKNL